MGFGNLRSRWGWYNTRFGFVDWAVWLLCFLRVLGRFEVWVLLGGVDVGWLVGWFVCVLEFAIWVLVMFLWVCCFG